MVKELLIDVWTEGDWVPMVLSSIIWAMLLLLIWLFGYGALYLIDSSYLQEQNGTGKIVDMVYHPAHTYTTFIHVNKVSIPQIHRVPESWECIIKVNNLTDGVSVTKYFYDRTPIGQDLNVTFTNGRIWDSMYIKGFTLKD
jgi:hypothetical protein